jgi:maltooligosyltrehalose trehalohydrolase
MLGQGFDYQGETSAHRDGRARGEPSAALAPTAFVNFLQNHDQIGNRALGERLDVLAEPRAIEAALAVTLLAPMPPLMFMGEEWGSTRPFPFFCDFAGALADAVRKGRRAEFETDYARFGDDVPDPLAEATFRSAVLDWEAANGEAGSRRLALVRDLLAVRRARIMPLLGAIAFAPDAACRDGSVVTAAWTHPSRRRLRVLANLSDESGQRPRDWTSGEAIWGTAPPEALPPWSVYWSIGS